MIDVSRSKKAFAVAANCMFVAAAIFAAGATALRLVMALTLHMWYAFTQRADDQLLMSYASPGYEGSNDRYAMAKNRSYGWFLHFVSWSGLSVDAVYFLLWLVAALLVAAAIHVYFRSRWLSVFAYLYVLWNPVAFEDWSGTRLYRNSVFAPVMFILLAGFMLYLSAGTPINRKYRHTDGEQSKESSSKGPAVAKALLSFVGHLGTVVLAVLVGDWFVFLYDLKEDSIWLVPILLAVVVIKAVYGLCTAHSWKKRIVVLMLCIAPLLTVYSGIQLIKANNERSFGVAELNTRTEGELARFISFVYILDNPEQDTTIWAPYDSIEAVFHASDTLSHYPDLLTHIEYGGLKSPSIRQQPLKGDALSWRLIDAIDKTIGMDDQAAVQRLFAKANAEIQKAFDSGELERTTKITVSESMVPRTREQIAELIEPAWDYYVNVFQLAHNYQVTWHHNSSDSTGVNQTGLRQVNIRADNPNPIVFPWFSFASAQKTVGKLLPIYSGINTLLGIALLLSIIATIIVAIIRKRWMPLGCLSLALCLEVYGFAYTFFVYWFSESLNSEYKTFFYMYGPVTALISMGLLLGIGSFVASICRNLHR